MNTNGAIITNAGLELISHALANNKNISFTKTKLGKGDVNSFDEAKKLNDIIQFYKEIPITSIARNNSGIVRIRSSFTNADFPHEVILKEVGIFAKTDETSEILFAYVNDGLGENFPPGNSGNVIERTRDIYVGVGSTVQVNAIIDKSVVYATVYDLEEGLNKKEDKFSKNSGFNKVKTDIVENDTNKIFTALGALNLKNWLVSNYTTLMNNIRGTLETAIGTKLAHGGYGGTGQTLFNLIESTKTSLTSLINGKENSFSKKSGFNLEKTDLTENNNNKLFTAKGALNLLNSLTSKFTEQINSAKTTLRSEMLNIKNSLTTLISNKLSHGGYSGTGQDLKNAIDKKQDINDNTLQTKSKVVAGAINELNRVKIDNSSIVNDLTTGGTNKVLSAEQGKNLDIYVKGKNTVKIKDDRERIPIPTDYESFNTTFTFNNNDAPFGGDWASIMTVKGWGEGYRPWQLAGHAGGYGPDFKGLWFREATAPNIWGSWAKIYTSSSKPTYKDVGALRKIELPQFTLTGNNPNPNGTNTFTLKLKLKQVGSTGWDFIMDITSSWAYSNMTGSSRYLIKFSEASNSIQCLHSNMVQGYELRFGHVRNENGFVLIDVYYGAGSNPFVVNLYETSAYIESAVIENIRTAKPFGRSYATCKKLLWEGDLGTGSFTLNEDIRNYDKILFYCTDDTNRYMSGQIYDVETLKKFKESGKYFNINTQLEGTYWYVSLGDDFRTFVMQSENSRVRIVFGVND